ncbi:hypothetical protein [Halopenitus persicus]|uniref:Uncharacterized protein n=1 Tax=Halopenitus persicus TaxID=1048396 RepID=A0A1H3JSN7_9EURY|nr:hypothetical protein [Halopenitus persicus]SDY42942.1 hypothetical protein SAMN05216564_105129 [Halopenitus persicus]
MAKKASVVIETEEWMEDDVDDDTIEKFVQKIWDERFKSVGYERDYEVKIESIEEE